MQAAPLDIWRVTVDSPRGEPLRASVAVQMGPGERIGPECLSLGDEQDAPDPDFPLVRNARFVLSPSGDTIEFTTENAITTTAVSVALRVQCPGEPIYVRVVNLLIGTPGISQPATVKSSFPGKKIIVKRGDSLYGLARAMLPGDEAGVRDLVQAIVIANPRAFPDRRPRALKVGEKLVMPELRSVQQVLASAAPPAANVLPVDRTAPAPAVKQPEAEAVESPPAPTPDSAAPLPRRPRMGAVKLRLRIATELDLARSQGVDETRRAELRRIFHGEVARVAFTDSDTSALELRVANLRESQNVVDLQLRRLEDAIDGLVRTVQAIPVRHAQQPRPTLPAPQPAPPPSPPIRSTPPTVIVRQEIPSWIWPAIGFLGLIIALTAFFLGRRARSGGPMAEHEARIDALLKDARAAAGPLLAETGYASQANASPIPMAAAMPTPKPKSKAADSRPATASEVEAEPVPAPLPSAPPLFDPEEQPLAPPPEESAGVDVVLESESAPQTGEVSTNLRQEMNQALDNSRSMFTDVDRFIALGRTDNAISLLQFQVHKDPKDRDSWIKLLAVYRQQDMEIEFERAHREFKRLFPGEQ